MSLTPLQSRTNQNTAFSFGDIGWALKILWHLIKTSGPEAFTPASIGRFFKASSNKERIASIITPISVDPYVLRKVFQSIDGDYTFLGGGTTFMPRDFDLWVRCSTELSHRGDGASVLFDKWFQGSCLNAQPERYDGGKCPFGKWEIYEKQEPHFMSTDKFAAQIPMMEKLIDDHMAQYVGKVEDVGVMTRALVWDLFVLSSYGEWPSKGSRQTLQLFEDHYPEFDYALRMVTQKIPYKWSNKLDAEVFGIGDWCWRVANDRLRNIEKCKDMTDVLTDTILKTYPEIDLAKSEGALRGGFTGGINNSHSCLCGTLIQNAKTNDSVAKYIQANSKNITNVYKEALRLYTSIPAARYVREEDNFIIDGKKLETGTSVVLSTYGMQTDPRNWENPLEFKPERFENTTEMGYMTQRGFAPLGVATELGGRPCGARYHDAHMLETIIGKLLRDYKFTEVGNGHFEMRQMAATSLFCGKSKMRVEKR